MVNPTTVRQLLISALIFTAIIAGSFAMIAQNLPADVGNFTDYNRSYNKFEEIRSNADDIGGRIEDPEAKEGVEGLLSGMITVGYETMVQVWTSVSTMKAIMGDLSKGGTPLALPTWFTGLLIGIILIVVAFAIVSTWMKWNT